MSHALSWDVGAIANRLDVSINDREDLPLSGSYRGKVPTECHREIDAHQCVRAFGVL